MAGNGLLPDYQADLDAGREADYARRLAEQGLAWWCELEPEKLAPHLGALMARIGPDTLPPRLAFLGGAMQSAFDQPAYLAWFERFQADGDTDAAVVAVVAAMIDIWQSGYGWDRFDAWHERAHRLLAGPPAPALLPAATLLGYMAAAVMVSGAGVDRSRRLFADCRRMAELAHSLPMQLFQVTYEAYAQYWTGEFSAAQVALEDATVLGCRPGVPYLAGLFLRSSLCLSLTLRGDPVAARHVVQDDVAQPGFDQLPPIPWLTVMSNLVYAVALAGDEVAVEALGERMRRRLVPDHNAFYHSYLHVSLGIADLLLGRPAAALAHARESRERAQPTDSPVAQYMPVLLEVQARVDLGDHDGALALAEAWLPKWRAVGHLTIAANAMVEMAVAHARQGRPDAARAALDQAHALLPRGEPLLLFQRPADYLPRLLELLAPRRAPADPAPDPERYPVAIHALGELRVRVGERVLYDRDWRGQRAKSLLKALLVLGGHKVSAQTLADLLWPDAEGDAARANLKVAVWRLRQLGAGQNGSALPWLLLRDGHLSLARGVVGVDALAFQTAANAALRPPAQDRAALLHALGLYTGDFLAGDDSELWIGDHRQRLRELYQRATRALFAASRDPAQLEQALPHLERGHALDPLDERAAESLIKAYTRLGYTARALETYRATEAALGREFGIAPGAGLAAAIAPLRAEAPGIAPFSLREKGRG